MKVIILTGKSRVGKDTFARRIKDVEEQKGNKVFIMGYADALKYICERNFGFRGTKDIEDRKILQETGDLFRDATPSFFVDMVNFSIDTCYKLGYDYFIITDARFDNEINEVLWINREVIKLDRTFDNGLGERAKHKSESGISEHLIDMYVNLDDNSLWMEKNMSLRDYNRVLEYLNGYTVIDG